MVLDFDSFSINESSIRTAKKEIRGILNGKNRKRMRELLRKHVVTFKFKKKNGEIRLAHGTLIPSYLPKLRGGAPRPEHQMVYYDLDKGHWRSFRSYSFIKILNVKGGSGEEATSTSLKHTTKPVSKPVSRSKYEEEEDERMKKKSEELEKEEEKEVKKVHKEDTEEKDVHKEESFKETEHDEKSEHKKEEHKDHKEHKEEHDEDHKEKHKDDEAKVGDKIPEDELKRRSADFRHGSRKNKFTREANDDFKKGKLKKDKEKKDEDE